MSNTQFYSNYDFDRAVELRETVTDMSNVSFIPVFKEDFFVNQSATKNIIMDTPSALASLSDSKYFLGLRNGKEVWCIDLSKIAYSTISEYLPHSSIQCLRDCFSIVNERDASILAYAKGIINWNSTHQFCNNCGSHTKIEEKGHRRKCLNRQCETLHFPRINPAIITLIEYKQNGQPPLCLLNMRKTDSGYMCSLFAGFSEIGESLEDTVRREMKEEVNVTVTNITYIASQPWIPSSSMMLGFTAEAPSKKINIDNKEIKKAEWFSANQINQMTKDHKLIISHKDSISNYIIEQWVKQNS